MPNIVALICGLLFGAGLLISGMTDPAKVIGFLDVSRMATGEWDPSLIFVMVGALGIYLPTFFLVINKRQRLGKTPMFADQYHIPEANRLDRRLLLGAAIFGIGWGMAGVCPGPGLTNIGFGSTPTLAFVASLIVGLNLTHFWMQKKQPVGNGAKA